MDERRIYALLNASTAPLWLAMILAPRSRLTARLLRVATPLTAGLGVGYAALLARATGDGLRLDFRDPQAVRAALSQPFAFLAGWAHYLAFDLFVGRWIHETGLAEGRSTRLALLLTWMLGPAGLTLFLAQRALRPRR
jgi:hypothetical protein